MANIINIKDASGTTRAIEAVDNTGGTPAAFTPAHVITDSTGVFFMPAGDNVARPVIVQVTNGTQTLPTMDAVARPGFVKITNGTQTMPTMDAAARPGFVTVTDGTNTGPTMDAVARPGFFKLTDGTNTAPTMDAVARSGFQQITDATNGPVAVKAASTQALATDKALVVRPMSWTDGTNVAPTMDAIARAGFQEITDGTNGPVAVKAASTGAQAADKALVVRPMMPTDGTNTSPVMDTIARAGFQSLTDGTTGPVFVTPASTAAVAGNKGLVVALHPSSPVTTNADGTVAAGTVPTAAFLTGAQFLAWGSKLALTTAQGAAVQVDQAGSQKVGIMPLGTPIYATVSNGSNSQIVGTLTIPAAKMGFLDGFDIDGLGATAGSAVAVTVTGILGGTLTFNFGVPAGATVPISNGHFRFSPPLQASATNTNIVVTLPALGSGNTSSSLNVFGHYV